MTEYYAGLRFGPASREAITFVDNLAKVIHPKPGNAFVKALGALIADLLRAEGLAPGTRCYRQVHNDTFVDQPVGGTGYNEALGLLQGQGYLDRKPFGTCPVTGMLKTTRYWATRKLIEEAEAAGLHVSTIDAHLSRFPRPARLRRPLVAKMASTKSKAWVKAPGRRIKIDYTQARPRVLAEQVNEINAFMADRVIAPDWHHAFRRIFNEADHPRFDFNRGGRLYSVGGGYQMQPSHERAKITIDGEETVEVDVKACFLTILYALHRAPFDPRAAYNIDGVDREAVKLWCVSTLSKEGFTQKWTRQNKADFLKKTGRDLAKVQPAKGLIAPMIKAHPLLADWPTSKIRWADLQYLESEVMVDTVHALATMYGVPALPVHDSMIVPISQEGLAKRVLKDSFERIIGVRPILETKVF